MEVRGGPQRVEGCREGGIKRPDVSVVVGPDKIPSWFVVQEDDASRDAELMLLCAQVVAEALLFAEWIFPGRASGPDEQPSFSRIHAPCGRYGEAAAVAARRRAVQQVVAVSVRTGVGPSLPPTEVLRRCLANR